MQGVTIQMRPLRQFFCMVPFVFQYFAKWNLGFFLNFDIWHSWELKDIKTVGLLSVSSRDEFVII